MTATIRPPAHGQYRRLVGFLTFMCVLLLASCGRNSGSESVVVARAGDSTTIATSESLFETISNGMRGTHAQAEAVRYLEQVGYQGLVRDCMAELGFTYYPEPAFRVPRPNARFGSGTLEPVDSESVRADPLGLDATIIGIVDNAKAAKPIVLDTATTDEPRTPEYKVAGWSDALDGCLPSDNKLNAWVNRPSYAPGIAFGEIVTSVLDSKPVSEAIATYSQCMRNAGWSVRDRHDLVLQVRSKFEDMLVDAADSFSTDPKTRTAEVDQLVQSAPWSQLVASKTDAALADAACRKSAHDLALSALLQPLQNYQAQHRDEIEQRRVEWDAVEQRADATPDPIPPA